jgi:D-glycero-D-manno-heptose 1,7-bisphosphate phosphatase
VGSITPIRDHQQAVIIYFVLPAIFLDRDGVIIKNRPEYIRSWEEVVFLPGVLDSLQKLARASLRIVIVTNQSVVGRGLITLEQAQDINDRLVASIIKVGGRIDSVYMCPHPPEAMCNCRKPRPGLFLEAAVDLSLDLENSVMVGDALTDLIAAWDAGIRHLMLVRTGRGEDQMNRAEKSGLPFTSYASLPDAIASLLS